MPVTRGGTPVTWYKMTWGRHANFIVQRAWYVDDIDGRSVLGSRAVLKAWKTWITQVTLPRRRVRSGEKARREGGGRGQADHVEPGFG